MNQTSRGKLELTKPIHLEYRKVAQLMPVNRYYQKCRYGHKSIYNLPLNQKLYSAPCEKCYRSTKTLTKRRIVTYQGNQVLDYGKNEFDNWFIKYRTDNGCVRIVL